VSKTMCPGCSYLCDQLYKHCAICNEWNLQLAKLAAEVRGWREAWDGRDDAKDMYCDPYHSHEEPCKWDGDGTPCASCQRFAGIEAARAATDADPVLRGLVEGEEPRHD